MLEVLFSNGIMNEFTQVLILGAALILKRNSKSKIKSLKELDNLVDDEIKNCVGYLEDNAVRILNALL